MKLKILLPITLAIIALIGCNGGGEGSAASNPGNDDDPLPPELQTYSYVANSNSSISVCKMTLNGFYRSPCANYFTNVLPNAYSIVVNNSNKKVFVTGGASNLIGVGYWQNCTIDRTNGGLSCDLPAKFTGNATGLIWPTSIATYYPHGTASDNSAKAYITDGSSNSGQIYLCSITSSDTLNGNSCTPILQTNTPAQFGLAIESGSTSYLYVSNGTSPSSVHKYQINGDYSLTLASGTNPISGNGALLSSAGKMVVNPISNYLYVSNTSFNSIAEYDLTGVSPPDKTSTVFNENDGIAINSLYGNQAVPPTNAFIYVTNHGGSNNTTPYISKCPINGDGTLAHCDKLGSGFYKPYAIAISGPVNPGS